MTLSEFHAELRATLKRGTALDANIPYFTRMAARFLERNYTFLYMERFVETTVPAGDRYITLNSFRVRRVEFFRWRDDEGAFSYVLPINPRSQTSWGEATGEERPSGYWRDGAAGLVLAATHDEDLTAELRLVEQTAWPVAGTATHWLLDMADDVLLAQAMIQAAIHLRDSGMEQMYRGFRDTGIKTLIDADIEDRHAGAESEMRYSAEGY